VTITIDLAHEAGAAAEATAAARESLPTFHGILGIIPGIAGACDRTPNNNERLIFQIHDVSGERSFRASRPKIPILNIAEASLCAGA
jgi:hypothetical protein